jgi:general secretion pathway protein C
MRIATAIHLLWSRRAIGTAYVLAIAFFLAHSVNAFVSRSIEGSIHSSPQNPAQSSIQIEPSDPKALARAILSGSLFALPPNPEDALDGPRSRVPLAPLDAAKKVSLIGTVMQSTTGGFAVLEDLSSKKQTLYHLGESVPDIGLIADVQRDKVLFRQDSREEWLHLELVKTGPHASLPSPAAAAAARPTRDTRIIDRRELSQLMADVPRLLQHAQTAPQFTGDRFDGFRLEQVNFHGFFGKMGLRSGDILKRINGVEIRDPNLLISALQQLKDERSVKIDIARNDAPLTFSYEIR